MLIDDDIDQTFLNGLFGDEEIVNLCVNIETPDSFKTHEFLQLIRFYDRNHD